MATRERKPASDREEMPGLPIEKKPGNVNSAPPAGERQPDVENSPSPYDRADPGTPQNRIIRQGEPEKPGPTSPGTRNEEPGTGSQPGEVAVGIGDGLEGAPVDSAGIKDAPPADAQSMKERHESEASGVNEVQSSRKADAEVGLGEGMEGAPLEEYEEELEIGEKREQRRAS